MALRCGHGEGRTGAVVQRKNAQRDALGIVVVRSRFLSPPRQHGVRRHVQRQAHEVMGLAVPARACGRLAAEQVRPGAGRQVEVHLAAFSEHGGHQQRIAQHVLAVQRRAGGVLRMFQQHRAHHGHAGGAGLDGLRIQVGHEPVLQPREALQHGAALFVHQPGHPVASCCHAACCARTAGRTGSSACTPPAAGCPRSRRCRGSRTQSRNS